MPPNTRCLGLSAGCAPFRSIGGCSDSPEYYAPQDIVTLSTVHTLQQMDLPLKKIKGALSYDDLNKIVDFLTAAAQKADEKITSIKYNKSKIQSRFLFSIFRRV